jgi:hypothetical protein
VEKFAHILPSMQSLLTLHPVAYMHRTGDIEGELGKDKYVEGMIVGTFERNCGELGNFVVRNREGNIEVSDGASVGKRIPLGKEVGILK